MSQSVLFVNTNAMLTMGIVVNELKRMGYDVSNRTLSILDFSSVISEMDNIVLCIDRESLTHVSEIDYIVDHCMKENKQLMLAGDANIVEDTQSRLPAEILGPPVCGMSVREMIDHVASHLIYRSFGSSGNVVSVPMNNRKVIMVVDDSGTFLLSVKRWLEPKYQVLMMNSAAAADNYMDKKHIFPDLMLLDMEMPNKTGITYLAELRNNPLYRQMKVIFLTNNNSQETIEEAVKLKPQGYILKSLPQKNIVERIDMFFESEELKK